MQPVQRHQSKLTVTNNCEALIAVAPLSVAELLARSGLAGKRITIERNGAIVPRGLYAQTPLADGDRVKIVVAVGGG